LVLVPAELEGAFEHAPVGDPGEWVGQRLPLSDVEANNDRDPVAVPMAQEHADLEDRPVADGGQERAPGPTQLPTGVIDIVEQVVVAVPPDHLGRAVTGKSFRGRVPVGDPTFGVDGVDRLAHGLQESLGRRLAASMISSGISSSLLLEGPRLPVLTSRGSHSARGGQGI
jgi:hypothetical protein